jgi:hypothetical protein
MCNDPAGSVLRLTGVKGLLPKSIDGNSPNVGDRL